jgi:molybdopterin-guanine dinucleotide biosynthesis protein A
VLFHLIEKLTSCFDEVLLSLHDNKTNQPPQSFPQSLPQSLIEEYRDRITPIPDIIGSGPLAGIYAGLTACKSEYLYVTACDMPFITEPFIEYMYGLILKDDAEDNLKAAYLFRDEKKAEGKNRGYEPFNAFYGKQLAPIIHETLKRNEYKIAPLFETENIHIIEKKELELFGDEEMFFNINRADDLEQAQKKDTAGLWQRRRYP